MNGGWEGGGGELIIFSYLPGDKGFSSVVKLTFSGPSGPVNPVHFLRLDCCTVGYGIAVTGGMGGGGLGEGGGGNDHFLLPSRR